MSNKRIAVVLVGVMLSLFMAAIEATVIATAMPTIVGQLGGLAAYSWVFSAYMLTSTTTVPLYGKLSDLYGRRRIFFIAMTLFLVGSVLSGVAQSMDQLIAFRALQGLGAGGLMPLAFIIIGDMLSFEQRARMQGLFSGVWGVASIAGPLLGGFLVDQLSWRWVFYVNIVPGLLAALLVGVGWRDPGRERTASQPAVDYAGALLLSTGVVALLLGLRDLGTPTSTALLAATAGILALLLWVERRALDPVLPLGLFRDRLFAVATAQGVLAGWAMFGSLNFVPLFGQAVLGLTATAAGSALTPMMLSWTAASIIGSRLLLRFGYRSIALVGMVSLSAGAVMMTGIDLDTTLSALMLALALMGAGMGLSIPAFLIAVQSSVPRTKLGTATATVQFSRSIGGTLGVSVMGVILVAQLAANLAAAGLGATAVSLSELIRPDAHTSATATSTFDIAVRGALANAISSVFVVALIAAVLALVITLMAPHGRIAHRTVPAGTAPAGTAPAAAKPETISEE
jgi:EmrB/QacA subfamily drug resistance transporter